MAEWFYGYMVCGNTIEIPSNDSEENDQRK